MNRHLVYAGILWVVLTAVGEVAALADIYPVKASDEADLSDSAFRFLMFLGVPVFTMVVAVLVYSMLRFRVAGEPTEDGPPVRGILGVERAWLAITGGLALLVIVYPGLTGLAELREDKPIDLVVQVEGVQWAWTVRYSELGVRARDELVVPVDKRIRFEVTSLDVLHSFWVPAWRMKVDAVPGMTTEVEVTTTKTGSFADDSAFRLQCAELCGLYHARMAMPVRVVSQDEFDAWVASKRQ